MNSPIRWERREDHVAAASVLGHKGGRLEDWESGICGLFLLQDEEGRYDGAGLQVLEFASDAVSARLDCAGRRLQMRAAFTYDEASDVWSRRDVLANPTDEKQRVMSCLSRFVFLGHDFDLYSQTSAWNQENQGTWAPLPAGGATIACKGLKTTEGAMPYAALRNRLTGEGIAFHLLPIGKWMIQVKKEFSHSGKAYTVLDMGLSNDGLDMVLEPGEELELPEILFHSFDDVGMGAHKLHQFVLAHRFTKRIPPVVYNTWFYDYSYLNPEELLEQARQAKALGFEVFVIDAGWFGDSTQWHSETGCWYENKIVAFKGRMKEFADQVREIGLDFGIWMEPERATPKAPLYQEHPEYFFEVDNGYIADMSKPWVQERILGQIGQLIDTYGLKMMKLDFNVSVSYDQSRCNFYRYYQGLYGMMDRLRSRYPDVVFEGCSSGGQRSDLNTIRHFDFHFISDTVHPREVLRIYQGALLRLPPGCLSKWPVIRSGDPLARRYEAPAFEDIERLYACADATWDRTIEVDLDYSMAIGFCGALGMSTDLTRMSASVKEGVSRWIAYYKEKREFLQGAACYQLTAPVGMGDIMTPAVFQLKSPEENGCLLVAFRMEDSRDGLLVRPKALDPSAVYTVAGKDWAEKRNGCDIMERGIWIPILEKNKAVLVEIVDNGEELG